ncbi:hypothetical protein COO91_00631 [Nostoc flagelliforme CCNUN1]|uniref:Uncharacterized protein n=1 Tax=Nostoc flagelliforme CCNUN1 TaxID=2038116 RepID=A0A2K8SHG3_9NOSO|nr:hypothetical protein [Nostoc flagelliforme]AUB34800.1 hypothetical protein COO91_00631 [Nostoc flagelliforme CCNUN1]
MEYSNNPSNSLVLWMRAIAILSQRIIKTCAIVSDRSEISKARWLRPHFDPSTKLRAAQAQ